MSNNNIVVFSWQIPINSINPFTKEIQELAPLPAGAKSEEFFSVGLDSYDIYGIWPLDSKSSPYMLFNYKDGSSRHIFQWLVNQEWLEQEEIAPRFNLNFWLTEDGLMTMVVKKTYGFDIASSLDFKAISSIKNYDEVMKFIALPGEEPDISLLWRPKDKKIFAFDRFNWSKDTDHQFYIFDYQEMVLIDYCLNRGVIANNIYISPDGRFLGWNVQESVDSGHPYNVKEVVILSLQTGRIAHIEGVRLIGWGKYH
jgi:hypothetical protein